MQTFGQKSLELVEGSWKKHPVWIVQTLEIDNKTVHRNRWVLDSNRPFSIQKIAGAKVAIRAPPVIVTEKQLRRLHAIFATCTRQKYIKAKRFKLSFSFPFPFLFLSFSVPFPFLLLAKPGIAIGPPPKSDTPFFGILGENTSRKPMENGAEKANSEGQDIHWVFQCKTGSYFLQVRGCHTKMAHPKFNRCKGYRH